MWDKFEFGLFDSISRIYYSVIASLHLQLLEVVFAYTHEFIFANFESSAQAHMHADTYLIITLQLLNLEHWCYHNIMIVQLTMTSD